MGVLLHVHLVLLRDVPHDPLGAAVLLRSQQPPQGLGEDPAGNRHTHHRKGTKQTPGKHLLPLSHYYYSWTSEPY